MRNEPLSMHWLSLEPNRVQEIFSNVLNRQESVLHPSCFLFPLLSLSLCKTKPKSILVYVLVSNHVTCQVIQEQWVEPATCSVLVWILIEFLDNRNITPIWHQIFAAFLLKLIWLNHHSSLVRRVQLFPFYRPAPWNWKQWTDLPQIRVRNFFSSEPKAALLPDSTLSSSPLLPQAWPGDHQHQHPLGAFRNCRISGWPQIC